MNFRQIALAAVATLASAGVAVAQAPWSPTPLETPFPKQATVSPIALTGGTSVVAGCSSCGATASSYATSSYAASAGGCSTCGSSKGGLLSRFAASPFGIGQGCANSPNCGSLASERTFLFGSCRQFFNAGNQCGGGCGSLYGPGGFGDKSFCNYGSYLNR